MNKKLLEEWTTISIKRGTKQNLKLHAVLAGFNTIAKYLEFIEYLKLHKEKEKLQDFKSK